MTPADRWSCASLASFAFGVGVMAHASLPSRVTVFGPSEVVTYVPEQPEADDD